MNYRQQATKKYTEAHVANELQTTGNEKVYMKLHVAINVNHEHSHKVQRS